MTPIWGITESGIEEDRPRSARASEDRALRSDAHRHHAAHAFGHQRHELHRALRGGALFEGRESDHLDDCRRRHSRAGRGAAGGGEGSGESGGSLQRALRRVAGRHVAGRGGHGAASQALPHARAAVSICRTPRRTPWSCRMRPPIPLRPLRKRCRASRARWARSQRRRGCTIWRLRSARQHRWQLSG